MNDITKVKYTLVQCEHINSRRRSKSSYINNKCKADKESVCKFRTEMKLNCKNCRYYDDCGRKNDRG